MTLASKDRRIHLMYVMRRNITANRRRPSLDIECHICTGCASEQVAIMDNIR